MTRRDNIVDKQRPRVSNDNPFSESQLKTQKTQPDYPGQFGDISHATHWCEDYFDWYNFEHHHSGLSGFTPEQVFTGRHIEIAKVKQRALDARFESNPERFVQGRPMIPLPPKSVAINPVEEMGAESVQDDCVNFPTLSAAGYVK